MRQSYDDKMTVCATDHSSTMYYSKLVLIETYVYFSVSMCPKLCSRAHGISYHNEAELILKSHFFTFKSSQVVLESLKLLSSNSEEKEPFFVKSKVYKNEYATSICFGPIVVCLCKRLRRKA